MDLKSLWSPKSVAVVGASERSGHGASVVQNLLVSKFAGEVYPVNPKYATINGLTCYPSLTDLPAVPECVVIAVPGEAVLSILDKAGQIGSRAAVIFTSGFAEAGVRGRQLQTRLREIADSHDMAVCGPNCMGLVNLIDRIPLYVAPLPRPTKSRVGNVAIVAQSGSVSVLFLYHTDRIPCSYVVSSGNQAVTDCVDYLRYFIEDNRTRVIGFFIESVQRPGDFYSAVQEASRRGKAVVICKTGRSERGNQAALAHTGSLAQPYEILAGLCRQAGAILTSDLDEMVETLTLLSGLPRLSKTPRVGLVTASGGQNALILDLAEEIGVEFASLAHSTKEALSAQLPDFATVENPLDMTGALLFDPEGYQRALSTIAKDDDVGLMAKVQEMPRPILKPKDRRRFWHTMEALVRAAVETRKPAVFITPIMMPSDKSVMKLFKPAGVTVLKGLHTSLVALRNVQQWARHQENLSNDQVTMRSNQLKSLSGTAIPELKPGRTVLHERLAKDLLKAAGFPVVPYAQANDFDGLMRAARTLGYPVVLKVDSARILHKTEVGGVRLDIRDDAGLQQAYVDIRAEVSRRAPDIEVSSYLVEKMVPHGTELIIGYKSDPDFGPLLMLGLGGTLVEVLRRVTIRRLPLREFDVQEMLNESPLLRQLLFGIRGAAPGDIASLKRLVFRISDFCLENTGVLREVDLNPVVVLPDDVRILDALIVSGNGS